MNQLSKLGIGFAVIFAIVFQTFLRPLLFTTLGLGRDLQPISDFSYTCRKIQDPRLQACEDLWISESTRQLFLACSDPLARGQWMPNVGHLNASGRALNDAVIAMDIDKPKGNSFEYRVLKTPGFEGVQGDGRLHLIGITGKDTSTGGIEIYLINARPTIDTITGEITDNTVTGADETIEVFSTTSKATELKHLKTYRHPEIRTPNNIALFPSGDGFYISNDHGTAKTGFHHTLAMHIGNGDITHCTSQNICKTVSKNHYFPNGLVTGLDNILYVPSTYTGDIKVYSIDPATGKSTQMDRIDIGYPLDNLSVDANGDIWAAALPKLQKVLDGFVDPLGIVPPTTVFRIRKRENGDGWEVKKMLEDRDSETLPGATTAVHDAKTGRVFLGGITAPFISVCDPK